MDNDHNGLHERLLPVHDDGGDEPATSDNDPSPTSTTTTPPPASWFASLPRFVTFHTPLEEEKEEQGEEGEDDDDDSDSTGSGRSPALWSSWPGRTRLQRFRALRGSAWYRGQAAEEEKDESQAILPWTIEEGHDDGCTTTDSSPHTSVSPPRPRLAEKPHRDRLWPVRLVVYSGSILTNLMMGVLAPFFARHATTHYNIGPSTIGLIFAVFPMVALIASPVASWLCHRFGRYRIHFLGQFWGCLGTIGFGLSNSVESFIITRGVQGLSFALINVSGLALLIQESPDLTHDIGRQETLVGLALVVSPALGGILYTYLGFSAVFLFLAGGLVLLMITVMVLQSSGLLSFKKKRPTLALPSPNPNSKKRRSRVPPPGVTFGATTVIITFNSISFLELAFSTHIHATLGLSAMGAGFLFSAIDVAYSMGGCLITGTSTVSSIAPKRLLALGLVLQSLGFVIMGPLPMPLPFHMARPLLWAFTIISCLMVGLGEALCIMPALQLMKTSLQQRKSGGVPTDSTLPYYYSTIHTTPPRKPTQAQPPPPPSSSSPSPEDDMLAAVMNSSTALGEFLGPFIGGFALEKLPQYLEMGCDVSTEGSICTTGFRWTSFCYAALCITFAILLVLFVPSTKPRKKKLRQVLPPLPPPPLDQPLLMEERVEEGGDDDDKAPPLQRAQSAE